MKKVAKDGVYSLGVFLLGRSCPHRRRTELRRRDRQRASTSSRRACRREELRAWDADRVGTDAAVARLPLAGRLARTEAPARIRACEPATRKRRSRRCRRSGGQRRGKGDERLAARWRQRCWRKAEGSWVSGGWRRYGKGRKATDRDGRGASWFQGRRARRKSRGLRKCVTLRSLLMRVNGDRRRRKFCILRRES